jgi:hypothetical protein
LARPGDQSTSLQSQATSILRDLNEREISRAVES